MFGQLKEKIIKEHSIQELMDYGERLLIQRFGTEKRAKKALLDWQEQNPQADITDFISQSLFTKEINAVFEPIITTKGMLATMREMLNIPKRFTAVINGMNHQDRLAFKYYLKSVLNSGELRNFFKTQKNKRMTEKGIERIIGKLNVTTKANIAKEFNVNKRTLNKWLKKSFGNKYEGVRRISVDDYREILLKFTLCEGEDNTFISKHIGEYQERLEKDLVHNQHMILQHEGMEGMTYRSLNESLRKKKLDNDFKKVPFSMKEHILEELDGK